MLANGYYEWEPPSDTYSLRNPAGGLFKLPAPDYAQLTRGNTGTRQIFSDTRHFGTTQGSRNGCGRQADCNALPVAH